MSKEPAAARPRSRVRDSTALRLAIVPGVALVILLLAPLWILPIPISFAVGDCGAYFAPCRLNFPSGSLVQASWTVTHNCPEYLMVEDDHGAVIYWSYAAGDRGFFDFVATNPPSYLYLFFSLNCVDSAQVIGTYYSTVL